MLQVFFFLRIYSWGPQSQEFTSKNVSQATDKRLCFCSLLRFNWDYLMPPGRKYKTYCLYKACLQGRGGKREGVKWFSTPQNCFQQHLSLTHSGLSWKQRRLFNTKLYTSEGPNSQAIAPIQVTVSFSKLKRCSLVDPTLRIRDLLQRAQRKQRVERADCCKWLTLWKMF